MFRAALNVGLVIQPRVHSACPMDQVTWGPCRLSCQVREKWWWMISCGIIMVPNIVIPSLFRVRVANPWRDQVVDKRTVSTAQILSKLTFNSMLRIVSPYNSIAWDVEIKSWKVRELFSQLWIRIKRMSVAYFVLGPSVSRVSHCLQVPRSFLKAFHQIHG